MEQQFPATAEEIFPHIRIVIGMVIGLGVTRLLTGVARMIQHPGKGALYGVHLAWVAPLLLTLVHFWWWEFGLFGIEDWTFGAYLFVIGYAIALFLICALHFPDSMADYNGYEDFFLARRAWFFGLLAATYAMDIVDTLIKGEAHFARFGSEYLIRTPLLIGLCLIAIWDPRPALPRRLRCLHVDLPDIVDRPAVWPDRLAREQSCIRPSDRRDRASPGSPGCWRNSASPTRSSRPSSIRR